MYPALVPYLRSEFGIGLTTTGLLLTLLWGVYAIGHVPGGILGDRIGEGNILLISSAISLVMILAVALAVNVEMLFWATVLFGFATALYGPTRVTIFTNIYPSHSGSAIGLNMAAGSFGNAVFPVAAAFVASYASWRLGFGMFVPAFFIAAVGIWMTVPSQTSNKTSAVDELSQETLHRIREGISNGAILTVVTIQICISFTMQGFSSFFPTYLASSKEISPAIAATLFGFFFGFGAILQPFSGTVVDLFGLRSALTGFLGGTVLGLWLLPFVHGLPQLIMVTALLATLTACIVITQSYIADTLPADMQGTGLGLLKAGWMILGATSPLLIGGLADYGNFDAGFFLLAAVASFGLVLALSHLPSNHTKV